MVAYNGLNKKKFDWKTNFKSGCTFMQVKILQNKKSCLGTYIST